MFSRFIKISSMVILLTGCTHHQKAELTSEISGQLEAANQGRIPLQDFFKEAEYSQIKISPDGRFLAALFPKNGRNNIAIISSDLTKIIFTGQFEDERHILSYKWVNNERLVLRAG